MKSEIEPYFFGIAAMVAAISLLLLWRWRNKLPLAYPNHRSLHKTPIPRVAALALWAGFAAGVIAVSWFHRIPNQNLAPVLWGGVLMLIVVSLWDDCFGVAPIYRFLVQTIVAGLLMFGWLTEIHEQDFFVFVYALAGIFLTVWMINLFNFMDGSDGLAVTMTITGFSALAAAAFLSGLVWWWLPALIVAASLPLWCVNFPPAKMFLGDVGAIPLGFLAAAFGGMGMVQKQWNLFFVLLVFLPFILDATLTLLRRLWRREKIWQAHKTHFYQKLAQTSAGHLGTLTIYGTLMAGCALTAVLLFQQSDMLLLALVIWVIIHFGIFAAINRYDKKK